MTDGVTIYTHADAEPDILEYVEGAVCQVEALGLPLDVVDLSADPIAAVRAGIHSVPAIIRQRGEATAIRYGTAPLQLVQSWLQ